jgi:hypothetical protein
MAPPPRIRSIARESIPGAPAWVDPLLQLIGEALGQVSIALSRRLTRTENFYAGEKLGVFFKTPASGVPMALVKWDTVDKPKHVDVTSLARLDGVAITAAWSCTHVLNQRGQIELSFQGLAASTDYRCNVRWE